MHPGEGSYSTAGAGGKVYVRDAKASEGAGGDEEEEGFGKEMRVMDTGKGKFGMNLQYVRTLHL